MNRVNLTQAMVYEENMARCRGVFKSKQINFRTPRLSPQQKQMVHDRMLDVFYLLDSYKENIDIDAENIHWVAILGAIGRLFEALLSYTTTANILTRDFKISARRVIYHSSGPFCVTSLGIPNGRFLMKSEDSIAFFMHCYEHCRNELMAIGITTPSLFNKISLADRELQWFHILVNTGSIWASDRVTDSETKIKALERLARNKAKFITNIEFLQKNERCFSDLANPEAVKISNLIKGNYLGAELAWLSCDVSSLRTGKAINEQSDKTILSITERNMIDNKYGRYVELGKAYRHENLNVMELLERYSLTTRVRRQSQHAHKLPEMLFSKATQRQDANCVAPNIDIKQQKNTKLKLHN